MVLIVLFVLFCFHLKKTDGNGGPDEVQLDAEMEKVFAGPGTREHRPEKFDVAQLIGDVEQGKERESQRFKDSDSDGKCIYFYFYFLVLFNRW